MDIGFKCILYVVLFVKDVENWLVMVNCGLFVIYQTYNQSRYLHLIWTRLHI